jgi:hypothetical protein
MTLSRQMVNVSRAPLVAFTLLMGCSGVRVQKTQTPMGPGYQLECTKENQCAKKAEGLCRSRYTIVQRSDPNDNSNGQHHWTIACGDAGPGQPAAPWAGPGQGAAPQPYAAGAGAPPPMGMQSAGLTLQQAKTSSVRLEPGMPRDAVASIFGPPKTTSAQAMGANTAAPGQGLIWTYEWWIDHPTNCSAGAFCRGRAEKLDLVFQRAGERATANGDAWVLNSWSWHE